MCQYLVRIAEGRNERAIFRCEHGSFHLAWDSGIIYLSADELAYLNAVFTESKDKRASRDGRDIRLAHRMSNHGLIVHELWIEEVGLRLSVQDCVCLKNLVMDAARWMNEQPSFDEQDHVQMAKMFMQLEPLQVKNESFFWN